MKINTVLDRFLLSNPFYRGMFEWLLLMVTGICGWMFAWAKFAIFPFSNILGGLIILVALGFHGWSERAHKQAHESADGIDAVVTSGAYAKIRHPLYLSLIILNLGIALAFGVWLTLWVAILSMGHWALTALREEVDLLKRFPDTYRHYRRLTKWRMIPGLF